ncbi:hypothetical protein F6V25_08180 [Oryzomonas japonica]|uniref:Cytochrome c7-like domain-containing protein n=1 Tax=Oryzomonas japonica TaxID=2603858 RepID=A0A7J4ZRV4_9BACT|nr:cytochrome c3 family protein [Oryzomonas japonica]KAB0665687.1 hypothetical protein F6V25_08180 [Oryzomonas japonica]
MKKLTVVLAVVLATAGTPAALVAADAPQNAGPEIIKLKMGDLYLIFKHWRHQKWSNRECLRCHTAQEWKIKNWDKEVAHQICIPCHDQGKKGPVDCKECHGPTYTSMKKDAP